MPGTTNFQQFNPPANNQENDATYTADSLRSAGAPTNAIFPSILANKMFFQWSIMIAALAQMLATKGYSPNDGSAAPGSALANLEAVLSNIMTQADMAPWALLASPTFTGVPAAPTPATSDNTTKLATTAFVKAVLGASGGFVFVPGTNGYIKFPAALGGLIIQWGLSAAVPGDANENSITVNYSIVFPTGVFAVVAVANAVSPGSHGGTVAHAVSPNTTDFTLTLVNADSNNHVGAVAAYWVAIGY